MHVVYSLLRYAELPSAGTPCSVLGRSGPAAAFRDTLSSVPFRWLKLPVFKSRHPHDPSKAAACSRLQTGGRDDRGIKLEFSLPKRDASSLRHSREGAGLEMQAVHHSVCLSPSLPRYKHFQLRHLTGTGEELESLWNVGLLYKLMIFMGFLFVCCGVCVHTHVCMCVSMSEVCLWCYFSGIMNLVFLSDLKLTGQSGTAEQTAPGCLLDLLGLQACTAVSSFFHGF